MNKLLYKAATGIATASLLAQALIPLAFADTTVTISGNGTGSTNEANVSMENVTVVEQSNTANIKNNVSVNANSGNNDANNNTGGNVSIDTGNASANVEVSNTANANLAEVDGCCPGDVKVKISGNGAESDNTVNLGVASETFVGQSNEAKIKNNVEVNLDTGNNDANNNTGGNVSIGTGNAQANGGVSISNKANKNVAQVGGEAGNDLEIEISGNGTGSTNEANVGVESLKVVEQSNLANIWNDVAVNANTGGNDANNNTGGNVEIDTGNASANVEIDNLANFNWADVDGCGCFFDVFVKISGNGAESDNTVNLDLLSALFVEQWNEFSCKKHGNPHTKCNDVEVNVDTGDNDSNNNTQGGEPEITTGNASADVEVNTEANANVVGDLDLDDLDFDFPDLDLDDLPGGLSGLILLLIGLFS